MNTVASNFSILIVEDDKLAGLGIEELADNLGYSKVELVDNSEDALASIGRREPDLIIMDINIKGSLNGIQVAEKISDRNIPIIYTTSYKEKEIYESAKKTKPVAYLVKPFNDFTLQNAIEFSIRSLVNEKQAEEKDGWKEDVVLNDSVFIKTGNVLNRIRLDKITWVNSDGNYCNIFTEEGRYAVKLSLSKLSNLLSGHNFLRVHQRSMIPLSGISNIDLNANVVYIGDKAVPIGPKYRNELLKALKRL